MHSCHIEYCGERYELSPGIPFHIGRNADLGLDDNRYLHRRCLSVHDEDGLWWLTNTGTRLPATVTADGTGFHAQLVPGSRIPLVFGTTTIVVCAGPTTYELQIHTDRQVTAEHPIPPELADGDRTIGAPALTEAQRALIVALAEPLLRRDGVTTSAIPSSAQAAARLGWPITRFNRKLDNVCDKLAATGVRGLRGDAGNLASNRRARLVEYALTSRIVTRADLALIDRPVPMLR